MDPLAAVAWGLVALAGLLLDRLRDLRGDRLRLARRLRLYAGPSVRLRYRLDRVGR